MEQMTGRPGFYELSPRQRRYDKLKRLLDVLLALVGLVLLALPFGLIALAQKCLSPREPVFFRQTRVGRGGELFTLWKFRSISTSVPDDLSTAEASFDRGQVTAFGRFLRRSSVDELPQLWQVLSGKMSLVGPRPLIPREREMHEGRWALGVYQLRPGLTGWAQIHGRDFVSTEDKLRYDRAYLEGMSLKMDLQILWRSVRVVLRRENIK